MLCVSLPGFVGGAPAGLCGFFLFASGSVFFILHGLQYLLCALSHGLLLLLLFLLLLLLILLFLLVLLLLLFLFLLVLVLIFILVLLLLLLQLCETKVLAGKVVAGV